MLLLRFLALHGGTFFLRTAKVRRLFHHDATLGIVTALVTGIIFLLRGRNYEHKFCGDDRLLFDDATRGRNYDLVICGDNELLFDHAINRQSPFGRLHFIDPFGLFDLFNGYLAVFSRIVTKILAIGGSEYFTLRVFWFMSFTWTVIAICIALVIGRFTRPYLGFLAAVTVAIMPFSNLVMMAQVNTLWMPAVLAIIITVVTRQYPRSRLLQFFTYVIFALVTLSTLTSVVVLGYLIWLVYIHAKTVQHIERKLVWVMGGPLVLHVLSYQSRGHKISPARFLHEILLVPYTFTPQFVREKILEPKTIVENTILYGIPILLGVTVFILVRLGNQSELRAQVKTAEHLFMVALLLIVMLIVGNGWLNSHYLFISTGLFWIGVLLTCEAVGRGVSRFRMIPISVVLVMFLVQLSGTYFVI